MGGRFGGSTARTGREDRRATVHGRSGCSSVGPQEDQSRIYTSGRPSLSLNIASRSSNTGFKPAQALYSVHPPPGQANAAPRDNRAYASTARLNWLRAAKKPAIMTQMAFQVTSRHVRVKVAGCHKCSAQSAVATRSCRRCKLRATVCRSNGDSTPREQ